MKNHRILIGITAVIALWLSYTLPMQAVEQSGLDLLSRFIPNKEFSSQVAVVAIDQKSIDAVGAWPWTYQAVAELLDKLATTSLKTIGVVLPLAHSENYLQRISTQAAGYEQAKKLLQTLDYDQLLMKALKRNNNVVLPIFYERASRHGNQSDVSNRDISSSSSEKLKNFAVENTDSNVWFAKLPWVFASPVANIDVTSVPTDPFSTHAKGLGLLSLHQSWTISQPFAVKMGGDFAPGFLGQMATQTLGVPATLVAGYGINIGKVTVQSNSAYRFQPLPSINSSGALNVPVISAIDVLNGSSAKLLKGIKAVLIGSQTHELVAYGNIPTTPAVWLAHSLNSLIKGEVIQQPYWSTGLQRLAIVVLAIYLMLLPVKLRGWIGFAITGLLSVLIINISIMMVLVLNFYQPLVIPALFVIFGHLLLTFHFKINHAFKSLRSEAANAYRELGLNLQAQGRLDQAFNYMRKCEMDTKLIECLYNLGLEFERRRQFNQAVAVYDYIARKDAEYRDIQERRVRHQTESNRDILTSSINSHTATLVVDHPSVARPVLGRYQVEKIIGQGAMGTVYLGVDPKISRTVAIKTLPLSDEFDSNHIEEVRRRFFREAETAGRLNHPNIVTIFDVGEEHDLAYIAMDYISGEGLDTFGHPDNLLSIDEVFHIGITVAEALDYAHQQNVVHRDIKPGNIIYDIQTSNLKVTDFGIACLTDNSRTRTGTVLGSPSYMSPEQLSGDQVDGRSDLYSLGVTLYQLFTGVLPFTADSMASLAYKIANNKPQGIRKIRPELPTCLTRVINKAIEKNPELRYQTGTAFADALRRCRKR
ncbi:protein kinase domain-containing protein [Kaarinaea lacus]